MVLFPAACTGFVIPAKAGIQSVVFLLDTRLRGCDDYDNGADVV
jgi:hypothetical protein